jgi:hypothetical protein
MTDPCAFCGIVRGGGTASPRNGDGPAGTAGRGGPPAVICDDHRAVLARLREELPPGDRDGRLAVEQDLRTSLFESLDVLAYALEMEAAEAIAGGDEAQALRTQQTRLGVRLAQRLVAGVASPEVDRRLAERRADYDARLQAGAAGLAAAHGRL